MGRCRPGTSVADLALGYWICSPSLSPLEEDDHADPPRRRSSRIAMMKTVESAPVRPKLERSGDRRRQTGHDACEDDERDAVAEARGR